MSEESFRDLYEDAPCGYLTMMADGSIVRVNNTFASWIGCPAHQLLGKRLAELMTVGTRILYETHSAPLLSMQGYFDEVSLDLRTEAGKSIAVFASARARTQASGQALPIRVAFLKGDERRRYERQLVDARDLSRGQERVAQRLLATERETSELREQFIAVLGHDLRNPLSAIGGAASLMAKTPLNERATKLVAAMQGSLVRMAGLIDNLLDFARGRLGSGLTLSRDLDTGIEATLRQAVDEMRVIAPDRAIEAVFSLTKPVDCDRARIAQLFSNLLGNALTHGSTTTPIRVEAATTDSEFVLSVANSGQPIPPAALERLFQPFYRGEVRSSQQGLGLGLFIASEIARAHRGALTVASNATETRFTLRMPLVQDDRADLERPS